MQAVGIPEDITFTNQQNTTKMARLGAFMMDAQKHCRQRYVLACPHSLDVHVVPPVLHPVEHLGIHPLQGSSQGSPRFQIHLVISVNQGGCRKGKRVYANIVGHLENGSTQSNLENIGKLSK